MEYKTAIEAIEKGHPYYQQGYTEGYTDASMKYLKMLEQGVQTRYIVVTAEQFEKLKKEATND